MLKLRQVGLSHLYFLVNLPYAEEFLDLNVFAHCITDLLLLKFAVNLVVLAKPAPESSLHLVLCVIARNDFLDSAFFLRLGHHHSQSGEHVSFG